MSKIKCRSKNTLMKYRKEELIDYCITLEHNNRVLQENFEIQYQNCMRIIKDMNILNKMMKNKEKK